MNRQKVIAALNAALAKSRELKTAMNVAFVDAGGNLVVFFREPGAWLGSIDIAQSKAYTAVAFSGVGGDPLPTDELGKLSQPGEPLFGIQNTNSGRIVIFGGGIPVYTDGVLAGAVGVSGSTVDNDIAVAKAAAGVFK